MQMLNERYRGSKGLEIQSWQTIIHWFIAIYLLSWFFFLDFNASKQKVECNKKIDDDDDDIFFSNITTFIVFAWDENGYCCC